uniref:Uncharacterized protein n=1 Tax=Anguilla anguilla TaxID=7936 RepID=A0A0E9TE35_ANGAN
MIQGRYIPRWRSRKRSRRELIALLLKTIKRARGLQL